MMSYYPLTGRVLSGRDRESMLTATNFSLDDTPKETPKQGAVWIQQWLNIQPVVKLLPNPRRVEIC